MEPMNILQGNLQHAKAATFILLKRIEELRTDLVLIQEPWISQQGQLCGLSAYKGMVFCCPSDEKPRAVILSQMVASALPGYQTRDLVAVSISLPDGKKGVVASAYFPADESVPPKKVRELIALCEEKKWPVLIGCDSNAHHTIWRSSNINRRGKELLDFLLENDLRICNKGGRPTFSNAVRDEVLDLTICDSVMEPLVENWMVSNEESGADHKHILFRMSAGLSTEPKYVRNPKKTAWSNYREDLYFGVTAIPRITISNRNNLDFRVGQLSASMIQAFEANCPMTKVNGSPTLTWWNGDIERKRKETRRLYNKMKRSGSKTDKEAYRRARNLYTQTIRVERQASYRRFTTEIETLPEALRLQKCLKKNSRIANGPLCKPDGEYTDDDTQALQLLLSTHFPGSHWETDDAAVIDPDEAELPESPVEEHLDQLLDVIITPTRVRCAVMKFAPYKSPGPDGIVPAMLQNGIEFLMEDMIQIFRGCIKLGYTPKLWQQVKVVFIPKPGRSEYSEAKDFRPISLSSFFLKTLERLIEWQVREEVALHSPLHGSQHAYQKNKSTETALYSLATLLEKTIENKEMCLTTFLDISGAFSNLSFEAIARVLRKKRITQSLISWIEHMLLSRVVSSRRGESTVRATVTRGCGQGGIISPLLWCLVADELLTLLCERGFTVQGYADDLAIAVRGSNMSTIEDIMQEAIDMTLNWCQENDLSVNPIKTEMVLFTRRKTTGRSPQVTINHQVIAVTGSVKYLGVIFDKRLTWKHHIQESMLKARRIYFSVKRMFSSTWGLKTQLIRWLYTIVVRPVISYGCIVWWRRSQLVTAQRELQQLQRLVCIGASGALRTTPTAALEVLLDLPPLHLYLKQQATTAFWRLKASGVWKGPNLLNLGVVMAMPQDRIPKRFSPDDCCQVLIPEREAWNAGVPIAHSRHPVTFYTDGSLMNGSAGAGVFCEQPDTALAIPLGRNVSVFQAEVFAIICALNESVKLQRSSIVICSDSQAAVMALSGPVVSSGLVAECRKRALDQVRIHHSVTVVWVPGHSDIKGNEAADELARQGSAMSAMGPEPIIPVGPSLVKNWIKQQLTRGFVSHWRSLPGMRISKSFICDPRQNYGIHHLSCDRGTTRTLVGLLTGHGPFLSHMEKIGAIQGATACRKCGEGLETTTHILCDCPALWRGRMQHLGVAYPQGDEIQKIPLQQMASFAGTLRYLWELNK